MKEGNRNTKFFHNLVKIRRAHNKIFSIKNATGVMLSDPKLIKKEAVEFFKQKGRADSEGEALVEEVLECILGCASEGQNLMLSAEVSREEVKKALWGLGKDKSPGPDGFIGSFFRLIWECIEAEIWEMVEEFTRGGFVLKEINNTFIALVPKKKEWRTFEDFRPISLCNILYKIISKVIANRLKLVLSDVISDEQSGFAPGRSFFGVVIAHEMIHSIRTNKLSKMMAKLDIRRAYDEVNRDFLFKVFFKNWFQ